MSSRAFTAFVTDCRDYGCSKGFADHCAYEGKGRWCGCESICLVRLLHEKMMLHLHFENAYFPWFLYACYTSCANGRRFLTTIRWQLCFHGLPRPLLLPFQRTRRLEWIGVAAQRCDAGKTSLCFHALIHASEQDTDRSKNPSSFTAYQLLAYPVKSIVTENATLGYRDRLTVHGTAHMHAVTYFGSRWQFLIYLLVHPKNMNPRWSVGWHDLGVIIIVKTGREIRALSCRIYETAS
ncbi:hypothetical protein AB1N83_002760 [Pleurotus pulmonarius]